MSSKKCFTIAMVMLFCVSCAVLAEEPSAVNGNAVTEEQAVPSFATLGEAMESDGYEGISGGGEEHFLVVVEQEGKYFRVVAEMDEEGKKLNDAIAEADDIEAAFKAFDKHLKALPVSYIEEITAEPLSQDEIDALAGKSMLELEEAGYEISSSGSGGEEDEVIFTVSYGLYSYDLIMNESFEEYLSHEDTGDYSDMTIRSASFAGLSSNAAEMRYHADGTADPEKDPWGEYNELMDKITEALESGEDLTTVVEKLKEEMPEQAEDIEMFAEIIAAMGAQDETSE
ncbi:MAG: hypothetical protein IJX90_03860 [Blautia sp.]|nr:hypothetical protein [Blautia sp.]